MATRRMISSDIWDDEFIGELSFFERLLWIGLFSRCADDQGRFPDNPPVIRAQVFPYDDNVPNADIDQALARFEQAGKVLRYAAGGKRYVQLVKWWENQAAQWANYSKHPGPPDWNDRVRTHNGQTIVTENWITPAGKVSGRDQASTQGRDQAWNQAETLTVTVTETETSVVPPPEQGADTPPPTSGKKQSVSKQDKTPRPDQVMFGALQSVCNVVRVTESFRGWANTTVKWLTDNGYTAGDVKTFGMWWTSDPWRKQNNGMNQAKFDSNFGVWVNLGKPRKVSGSNGSGPPKEENVRYVPVDAPTGDKSPWPDAPR